MRGAAVEGGKGGVRKGFVCEVGPAQMRTHLGEQNGEAHCVCIQVEDLHRALGERGHLLHLCAWYKLVEGHADRVAAMLSRHGGSFF